VTSRWVVELFGTVWVLAKSLPSSHIAPSAHRPWSRGRDAVVGRRRRELGRHPLCEPV